MREGDSVTPEERKREKARQLRYRKPAVKGLNLWEIRERLDEMMDACDEVRYWTDNDEETLLAALDGDEDDEYEFKMMFADLSAEIDRFYDDLQYNCYVEDHFDDVMVGIGAGSYTDGYLGFDTYEGDYFGIDVPEDWLKGDAGKKLERMTKKELIETMAQCLKIVISFLGIRARYDSIKAALDILRSENVSYLKEVKKIGELYEAADQAGWYDWKPEVKEFERTIAVLPQVAWIQ